MLSDGSECEQVMVCLEMTAWSDNTFSATAWNLPCTHLDFVRHEKKRKIFIFHFFFVSVVRFRLSAFNIFSVHWINRKKCCSFSIYIWNVISVAGCSARATFFKRELDTMTPIIWFINSMKIMKHLHNRRWRDNKTRYFFFYSLLKINRNILFCTKSGILLLRSTKIVEANDKKKSRKTLSSNDRSTSNRMTSNVSHNRNRAI